MGPHGCHKFNESGVRLYGASSTKNRDKINYYCMRMALLVDWQLCCLPSIVSHFIIVRVVPKVVLYTVFTCVSRCSFTQIISIKRTLTYLGKAIEWTTIWREPALASTLHTYPLDLGARRTTLSLLIPPQVAFKSNRNKKVYPHLIPIHDSHIPRTTQTVG